MAETIQRNLPAQFIEDLGKDYAKQLTATTAIPVDTSKFAPQVAAQDALQTQAATLGLAPSIMSTFAQPAQTLARVGQARDIRAQQPITEAMQRFAFEQAAPSQALQQYGNIVAGTILPGTITTTGPGTRGPGTAAGAGAGALIGNLVAPGIGGALGGALLGGILS